MNIYKKTIFTFLVSLFLGFIFIACENEKPKNETVEISEAKPVTDIDQNDYRFPKKEKMTNAGYPIALCGLPITKTPVIVENDGVTLRDYPKHYNPGSETLGENEMRITIMGSGLPAPIRASQATSCVLVELGNGENFIFDIGSDNAGKLYSMGIHPSELDKVFITHLHLDHVGGIFPLFDAMGWARNTPLRVWGGSGHTPELGTKAFTENVRKAAEWHVQAKQDRLPVEGAQFDTTEIDINLFSLTNPEQLVYDNKGVKIYAFPIVHSLSGSLGYRLEWKGLSMAYVSDSEVSTFEANRCVDVDVLIHEVMPSAEAFAKGNKMPLEDAQRVISKHTTPSKLAYLLGITKPRLGVGTHSKLGDETTDDLFSILRKTYQDPFLIAQDLSTINVTSDYIVMRQTQMNLLGDPPAPKSQEGLTLTRKEHSDAIIPEWLTETIIHLD